MESKTKAVVTSLVLVAAMLVGAKYVTVSAFSSAKAAEAVQPAAPAVAAPAAVAPAPAAVAPAATPAEAPAEVQPAPNEEGGWVWLVTKVQGVFKDWKTIGWQAGLIALLVLLIGTFKNSVLRKYLWDWAGEAKVLLPYAFALIIVLLSIPKDQWGVATVFLAITTGGGAVALDNLLSGFKQTKLGQKYVWLLDLIGSYLKKPAK